MKKSILALLLAVLMVASLLPATAMADGKVAEVNGEQYDTLAEAIANVGDGGTITVLRDITDAVGIAVASGKNFTIDFDEHEYILVGPGAGSAGTAPTARPMLAARRSLLTLT